MLSSLAGKFPPAILALADGSVFIGQSIGSPGTTTGELVFHTAMTGHQEALTDAASHGQILTFTCPHVGNSGINLEDGQSPRVQAAGLVIRDLPLRHSNFRAQRSLQEHLQAEQTVAVADVDTRQLTRLVRSRGRVRAAIHALAENREPNQADIDLALAAARQAPADKACASLEAVGTQQAEDWRGGLWAVGSGHQPLAQPRWTVLAFDLGVRRSDLRLLAERGCQVHLVPARTPLAEALAQQPADGLLLAGGPAAGGTCDWALTLARELLASGRPVLGLGLGQLLLAQAAGARVQALAVGHHGANHPVRELASGRVDITLQACDVQLDADSLPPEVQITHRSLIDDSVKGLQWTGQPVLGFEAWATAVAGPHELGRVLDRFVQLLDQS